MPRRAQPSLDHVFHALGDPTRRRMVEALGRGPLSVSRLAEPFALTLAAVIQHLQILERSGLVRSEKIGRVRTCSLDPAGLRPVEQWMEHRRSEWEQSFDRLGDLLREPPETS